MFDNFELLYDQKNSHSLAGIIFADFFVALSAD
jgi:hypothetical protein